MLYGRISGMAAALVLAAGVAQAGEVADLAAKAEQLLASGKAAQAWQAMDAAAARLWEQLPLSVSKALFVQGKPRGFGIYTPRDGSVFKPGEPLVIYAELVGFGHRPAGNGLYEIAIDGDVAIANDKGQVLAKMPDFLKSRQLTRHRNREFFVQMTLELSGAPAGRYVVLARLKDRTTGRTATLTLPFRIGK